MARLLLIFLLFFTGGKDKVYYSIQASSRVSLDLNTNLTRVSCKCLDNMSFATDQTAEFAGNTGVLQFHNTALKLDVKMINCRNKNINNDLRETLSADKYPHIELELVSVNALHQMNDLPLNIPKYFDAATYLTIAGKKLPQKIKTTVIRTDADTFRMYATQNISLDAYNIVPKSPVKFIKIHDTATVTVDLLIKLKDKS
ncbi:YceI family protein [Leadbetterella sp. DM7]|uniref:YceI family protein n=1 Tax=Leadbetterella sp. DM7 TaxID=3235085 RepID=UPI00349EBB72